MGGRQRRKEVKCTAAKKVGVCPALGTGSQVKVRVGPLSVSSSACHMVGPRLDSPLEKSRPCELQALCRIWDRSGLLGITAGPLPDRLLTRVFAAFKAPGKQRQIGDRRGQNSLESQLTGPSRFLPTGPQLCLLTVPRNRCLVGSVTDRRDFIHRRR